MKLLICYFDTKVPKMFVEKVDENGEKSVKLSTPYNFVERNEIVAHVVNADSPEEAGLQVDKEHKYFNVEKNPGYKAGEGIYFDQFSNSFMASEYGFLLLDRKKQRIHLITPIQVNSEKTKAFYIVFPTKTMKIPEYKDIEEALYKKKIVTIADKENVEEQLNTIDPSIPKINRILAARGVDAKNGYDQYFVPLLKIEKKAGKVMEDGRIDFKELDSIIEIKRGQEILRRIPAMKPEDGMNIYGEKVAATIERKEGFIKGDHIVESLGDDTVYISDIDGCLNVEGKRISVSPFAVIRGDVNYDSGNIDFNGSVHVLGSILPGFSVKAKDDIIVDINADDAYMEAGGNISVRQGIAGKGAMKVIAGGNVKAKYILNSEIEAFGEIEAEESIINSKVYSDQKIMVAAHKGKIIGGETIAKHEIIVNEAGVPKENVTKLKVGVSLFVEREYAVVKKEYDTVKLQVDELMNTIKLKFGEGLFEDPKKFLAILPPVKKKTCLQLLKELTDKNNVLKEIAGRQQEVLEKLKFEREPVIIVTETVYPGTIISIKKSVRKIKEKLSNCKFYEDQELKEIRFTSAT